MSTRSVLLAVLLAIVLVLAVTWLVRSSQPPASVASPAAGAEIPLPVAASELEANRESDRPRVDAALPAASTREPTTTETVLDVRVVSAESGQPLVRVAVRLATEDRQPVAMRRAGYGYDGRGQLYTDEQGRAAFVIPAETRLQVDARGQRGQAADKSLAVGPFAAGTRTEVVVELATAWMLPFHGRVVAASDGVPIANALVLLEPGDFVVLDGQRSSAQAALRETRTDAHGVFELRLLDWQHALAARIERAGFGLARIPITAGHEMVETALEVRLEASASVRARVVDGLGRGRSADVLVLRADEEDLMRAQGVEAWYGSSVEVAWKATTGADGSVTIDDLPPNVPLSIEILAEGRPVPRNEETLSLAPGERREIELAVLEGLGLRGRVLEDNAPLAHQEVWLVELRSEEQAELARSLVSFDSAAQEATSDEEGRFHFDAVLPGTWRIGTAPAQEFWDGSGASPALSIAETVEIVPGVAPREVVLRVERGSTIRGSVLSPAGDPLAAVTIFAASRAPFCFVHALSRSDGTFVVGPIGAGEYTLNAAEVQGEHAPSEQVLARAGATDVVLRMQPGATIEGLVVDAATRAECASDVALVSDAGGSVFEWIDRAPEGRFEYQGLRAGRYTVTARTADGRFGMSQDLDLAAGARLADVLVSVEAGAKLRIVASGKGHVRVEIWQGTQCVAVQGVRGGASQLVTVPAGELSLRTRGAAPAASTRQDVTLSVGEERAVTIDGAP